MHNFKPWLILDRADPFGWETSVHLLRQLGKLSPAYFEKQQDGAGSKSENLLWQISRQEDIIEPEGTSSELCLGGDGGNAKAKSPK